MRDWTTARLTEISQGIIDGFRVATDVFGWLLAAAVVCLPFMLIAWLADVTS